MKKKIDSYLGLAKRSGKLVSGYNTCVYALKKGQLKLMIIAVDVAENTTKKIISLCDAKNVPYRVYGNVQELSYLTGANNRGVFGITSPDFSIVIIKEIDNETNSVTR